MTKIISKIHLPGVTYTVRHGDTTVKDVEHEYTEQLKNGILVLTNLPKRGVVLVPRENVRRICIEEDDDISPDY